MATLFNSERVKKMAGLFFTPMEIALMLGYDNKFVASCKIPGTDEYNAYQSGRLTQEMLVRESIISLAKQGSQPAQVMAKKIYDESEAKSKGR